MQNWRRWLNEDHPIYPQTGRRLAPRPLPSHREDERKEQFEQEQANYEAERNRKAEILQARENTLNRILENAPPTFTAAQLRVFLSALCNLDPYTITEDVADHFAEQNNDHQQTPEEILAAALSQTPDERLTSFALRLALTGYVTIPHEDQLDYLAEAEAAFVAPPPAKKKPKPNRPTLIKASPKATPKKVATSKKKVAA
jgi:ParB family chromosome partitioning protein